MFPEVLTSFFLLTMQRAKHLARWKLSELAASKSLFLISECKGTAIFLCTQTNLDFFCPNVLILD